MQAGHFQSGEREGTLELRAGGRWDIVNAGRLDAELRRLPAPSGGAVRFDLAGLQALDTAGAWLIHRTCRLWQERGLAVELTGASPVQNGLLQQVAANDLPPAPASARHGAFADLVADLGAATIDMGRQARDFTAFFGLVLTRLAVGLARPRRLRLTPLVAHMQTVGLTAMPIVGLISFLIGIVLAYQGADQLRQFGAEVFVVDLVALSVLRELGILLTAIVVAGRSGSAFTAQIGSMKMREEIDAMRILGIDPVDALVLPRLLALVLTLPLLGFFADVMALLGAGLMTWQVLDIVPVVFLERLGQTPVSHYLVGLAKAPVFAAMIALVGCYEGLRVSGSAESVGQQTTRSVVESIFLVIVVDAVFSIFFSLIGV